MYIWFWISSCISSHERHPFSWSCCIRYVLMTICSFHSFNTYVLLILFFFWKYLKLILKICYYHCIIIAIIIILTIIFIMMNIIVFLLCFCLELTDICVLSKFHINIRQSAYSFLLWWCFFRCYCNNKKNYHNRPVEMKKVLVSWLRRLFNWNCLKCPEMLDGVVPGNANSQHK